MTPSNLSAQPSLPNQIKPCTSLALAARSSPTPSPSSVVGFLPASSSPLTAPANLSQPQTQPTHMIQVTVTCNTNKTWNTRFNGDHDAAVRYFLGQVFTDEDETTGKETVHRVVRVESNPIAEEKPDAAVALLLSRAEANLADLRAEYQRGEAEDIREKYLDEIRDEIDKAAHVVAFLKSNI